MTSTETSAATSVAPGPRPDEATATGAGLLVGVLVTATFVMILNETIVSVALPVLADELAVPASTVQWLTSGFLLTMAVVIPTTGYLLQRFSARQMFVAALTAFSTGTLVAALAPGFPVLLGGRVLQAAGTAVMLPLLLTTILRVVPVERRGATMGTVSIVIAVAPAIGPTVGGGVLAALGWRAMFWVVLPLALTMLAVGAVRVRVPGGARPSSLDVVSVLLSAVGFGALVYGSSAIGQGAAVPAWLPLLVGAAALTVFTRRQLRLARTGRALLDLGPLRYRPFVVASAVMVLIFAALLGIAAVLLPLQLQTVLGYDAFTTGLAVLPGGLVLGALGPLVGRLFDRYGARPLVLPGAAAMAAALWGFALLPTGVPLAAVIGVHVLFMAAFGFLMTPLMTDALGVLPHALQSHGSAITTTLQQVAGAFGTAGFVTIATLASAASGGGGLDAGGLRAAFVAGGVVGTVALGTALLVGRRGAGARIGPGATAVPPEEP